MGKLGLVDYRLGVGVGTIVHSNRWNADIHAGIIWITVVHIHDDAIIHVVHSSSQVGKIIWIGFHMEGVVKATVLLTFGCAMIPVLGNS